MGIPYRALFLTAALTATLAATSLYCTVQSPTPTSQPTPTSTPSAGSPRVELRVGYVVSIKPALKVDEECINKAVEDLEKKIAEEVDITPQQGEGVLYSFGVFPYSLGKTYEEELTEIGHDCITDL